MNKTVKKLLGVVAWSIIALCLGAWYVSRPVRMQKELAGEFAADFIQSIATEWETTDIKRVKVERVILGTLRDKEGHEADAFEKFTGGLSRGTYRRSASIVLSKDGATAVWYFDMEIIREEGLSSYEIKCKFASPKEALKGLLQTLVTLKAVSAKEVDELNDALDQEFSDDSDAL